MSTPIAVIPFDPSMLEMPWEDMSRPVKYAVVRHLAETKHMSAGIIARKFGLASRGQIIGIARRAKIRFDSHMVMQSKRAEIVRAARANHELPPPFMPAKQDAFHPLPGTEPIDIMDLPKNWGGVKCRWPVEGGFCGLPSGEKVYCETHDRMGHHAR